MTARTAGDVVVFRIGMHINRRLKVWKWVPVIRAMFPMMRELYANQGLGFLGAELHFTPRGLVQTQYWTSAEALFDYAHSKDHAHLPAWRDFNQTISDSGDVGIFHETYLVRAGAHESLYHAVPTSGLGLAGELLPADGPLRSARGRWRANSAQAMSTQATESSPESSVASVEVTA